MKAIISALLVLAMANLAQASDFAVALGLRSNNADSVTAGGSVDSDTGFGAGVIGFFDLGSALQMRSGFLYNQRNFKSGSAPSSEVKISYIDIPVTLMYKFADYAGVFGGAVLGLKASDECKVSGGGSCGAIKDPDSLIYGFQFGVSFKFAPQMGAELYYEMIPGEFWEDVLKNATAIGANFLYTFE